MDFLAAFILASLIGAGCVAFVIHWSSNRAAGHAITRHFQDAEHILDTGEPPPSWLGKRKSPRKRLDEMILFYENSPFYDEESTRESLLAELEAVRRDWSNRLDD